MKKIIELDYESYQKFDKEKYESEIEPYLPDKIFDIHAHIGNKETLGKINSDRLEKRWELGACASLTFHDYVKAFNILFPDKTFKALFFGYPFREINLLKANEYIGKIIDNENYFGLITAAPLDSYEYLNSLVRKYSFIGFKPYPDLYLHKYNNYNISDYVSNNMLEIANEYSLIILLHLKSKNEEQGINCDDYIKELLYYCEKYPNIKFIIPHLGRSHCPNIAEEGIKKVIKYLGKNKLYFDTSSCTNLESFSIFLNNYPIDRILFGNDFGICLIRAKFYCINGQERILVPREDYSWYKGKDFDRNLSIYAYESLIVLIEALKQFGKIKENINKIIFKNSENLIREVVKNESFRS